MDRKPRRKFTLTQRLDRIGKRIEKRNAANAKDRAEMEDMRNEARSAARTIMAEVDAASLPPMPQPPTGTEVKS